MEEFDAHDIDTSIKLDNYERKQQEQTAELRASTAQPQPPPQTNNANEGENNADENDNDYEQGHEEEPSLFDILHDNDDPDSTTNQMQDMTRGSTMQGIVPQACQVLAAQLQGRDVKIGQV